jgi:hypothetical protein
MLAPRLTDAIQDMPIVFTVDGAAINGNWMTHTQSGV